MDPAGQMVQHTPGGKRGGDEFFGIMVMVGAVEGVMVMVVTVVIVLVIEMLVIMVVVKKKRAGG